MDYTQADLAFQLKKTLRYLKLYGFRRTMAKIQGQYHMRKKDPKGSLSKVVGNRNVAIIGCGNYSFNVISFYLKEKGSVVRATMDVEIDRAKSLAFHTRANYYTTSIDDILNDEYIKLVYIASNHFTHAEYAIELLREGKNVHIEKPHVVNDSQLDRLIEAMNNSSGKVRLGFNRPSSRFGKIILDNMQKQQGTSMINWFVAGHAIDPDHWYFDEKEGGRVLGNLCHWTDFIYHQLGAQNAFPVTIYPVVADRSDCDISVSLVSVDGSIASITFSAKGHTFEGVREKLNVHKGNMLLTMSDYETLRIDIVDKRTTYRNIFRDHGHRNNILRSYEMLNDGDGEAIGYVSLSAKLFLSVKKSLETQQVEIVDV